MEYSPDVVYFFNKSKTKSFIFTFLNELLDKTKYVIHSLGFDKNLIITTPWEFLSQLVIFDMIDFEDLKNCHDKIVNYIHIKRGKVWINHSSKDIENYIITYKDEFKIKIQPKMDLIEDIYSDDDSRIIISNYLENNDKKCNEIITNILNKFKIDIKTNSNHINDRYNGIFKGHAQNYELISKIISLIDDKNYLFNNASENFAQFDFNTFYRDLVTRSFGRNIVIFDILSSTVDFGELIAKYINDENSFNLVIMANEQINGHGRHGNKWISNKGCLMLTMMHNAQSHIPITLLQHIICLSFVNSIKKMSSIKLKIKWPNDIYYENKIKLGGVLVKYINRGQQKIFLSSIGVNLNNRYPTTCINDIIDELYEEDEKIKKEKCLANFLNFYEDYITEKSISEILNEYKENWIHSNQEVDIEIESAKTTGVITGIDENGYLIVLTNGKYVKAHPDGNSFDLTKNLIISKK